MKKIISISLVLAMILTSSIMTFAQEGINTVTPKQQERSVEKLEAPKLTSTEINTVLEKEATKLGITIEALKAKLVEKAADKLDKKSDSNTTEAKPNNINTNAKLSELKAAFKAIKKDHIAKKILLEAIAKAKQEAKDERIDVFVKGEGVDFVDVPPVIKNDHTLIPVRAIMKSFGAEIAWDEATSTVTITKDATIIKLVIGSNIAVVNGVNVTLETAAEVINDRTLVPIRFVAETLKQKVEYDDSSKTIIIDDKDASDTTDATPDAVTADTATPNTVTQ